MNMLLLVVTVVCFLLLVLVSAVRPPQDEYSVSELRRRAKSAGEYKKRLMRQELLHDVYTFIRLCSTLLLVITIALCLATFGWLLGILVAVIVAAIYLVLARSTFFTKSAQKIYGSLENKFLQLVQKFPRFFHFLRETPLYDAEQYHKFDSREELAELIENAQGVLSPQERSLMTATMAFRDKTIREIMTPRTVIDSINKGEFLGPLVLDELHALGHSRLPVIDGDLDHIVGVLHLRDLLSLDEKDSKTAEKAMDPKVYYIREDDSLEHALAAFLKNRRHLFVVINENRETVGLVSLEDVIEALIGRRIMDEDDIHADLQAVARQEGKSNNAAPGHVDL